MKFSLIKVSDLKLWRFCLFTMICIFLFNALNLSGIETEDTRMLSEPAVNGRKIAFAYAEDIWIQDMSKNNPRRIFINEGNDSNPVFSPDGSLIAFSSEQEGNTDVYIVPSEGGIPERLTWHPAEDLVRGFTPDGKNVLFSSARAHPWNYTQLYTVSIEGGFPRKLDIPNGFHASYSTDGQFIAYTPLPDVFEQWKNYRGGAMSRIWIFSFADHSVKELPKPHGGCNDTKPVWAGGKIYFLSDRDGEFNLYSYDTQKDITEKHTDFKDFPVLNISSDGKRIILEQAGFLHSLDLDSGSVQKLAIGISSDLPGLRQDYVRGGNYIRSSDVSPSGARAVFGFRGDIITVPAKKGDPRNITRTAGIHERYPSWSPDGKYIAYFTDISGEYQLAIKPQDGKGEEKIFNLDGAGFYAFPRWSPDSRKIAYSDNSRSLYLIDVKSGINKKIASDDMYVPGAFRDMAGSWSSDSRYLSFTKVLETHFKQIFIYCLEEDKSIAVSDGLYEASDPVFDPEGRYLCFFASSDAGPKVNWFDLSNSKIRATKSIYLITLQKDTPSPFLKESDEEKPGESRDKGGEKNAGQNDNIRIDFEGINNRTVSFPVKAGSYSDLGMTGDGNLLFIERGEPSMTGSLKMYDMKKKDTSELLKTDSYITSANGSKILYQNGNSWYIADAGLNAQASSLNLNVGDILLKTDPPAEWAQILDEAWRINRDYFYDPGMHGADWEIIREKYRVFLPHLTCSSDLYRLIKWMCSELSVGHHYVGEGNRHGASGSAGIGLLGADYEVENNRYRISKIYGGLNWDLNLRSPLTEPGIDIKEGEYILAVNGCNIDAGSNIYSFFENTAGRITELTVSPDPDYKETRLIKAVPVQHEHFLRSLDWVEGNLKKVTDATDGQVAYVYVPNTSWLGLAYFTRYFFPQSNRKAVIIDERSNGGGMLADYYIDILARPYHSHWNFRYGMDMKTPSASIQGPKIMIINETAVSGGDMLPYMFKKHKIGTLVGKRTFGALVGILGFPELMDGGYVTAPNLAIWTNEGFIVENAGINPDIEVEQWPADIIEGHDPQLEKAIELALKELEENPPEEYSRPPYPVRVR